MTPLWKMSSIRDGNVQSPDVPARSFVGHGVLARNTLPSRPEPSAVFDLLLPRSTRRLIVYPAAIDTRWGPERLRATCERDLGVELDRATAVLFYNRARDTLVLYTLDPDGDRCIKKKLVRGAFLAPVPAAGQKYVVVDASKISKLFQGPDKTDAGRREAKKMKETTLRPMLVADSTAWTHTLAPEGVGRR